MNMSQPDHLVKLVLAVQRGDDEAFSSLYDALVNKVYSLASHMLNNKSDAEEVVCDVFTQIWQQANSYHPDKGSVTAWCMVIARSRSLDYIRRRARTSGKQQPIDDLIEIVVDEKSSPDAILSLFQENSRSQNLLRSLPVAQRNFVTLSFLKGLSHREISELTNTPLGSVKSGIRRALEKLQQLEAYG